MRYAEFIQREHFTYEELLGLSQGNLIVDAPNESIRLPARPPSSALCSDSTKDRKSVV